MKAPKLLRRMRTRRYGVLYVTMTLLLLIIIMFLATRPRLQRRHGWIGIRVQPHARGALVISEVVPGSPAYDVGILPGDAILSYHGVAVPDVNTLKLLIVDTYVNQEVRIIVERNGKRLVADTRIAHRPTDVAILPVGIPISQGSVARHEDRGLCINCHSLYPPAPSNSLGNPRMGTRRYSPGLLPAP
jgi:membrane-associated protease RseP (regulator of RpoE activity)